MICCRIRAFGMRRKEKLILYFILFIFVLLFLGSYFQLPQDETTGERGSLLGRAYEILIKGRKVQPIQPPKRGKGIIISSQSWL